MPTDGKIIKNINRSAPEEFVKPTPFYESEGIEPYQHKQINFPGQTIFAIKGNEDNPRLPRVTMQVPYAEPANKKIGTGYFPNVGNNIEQTWSGISEDVIDDLDGIDPNHEMIDNNDFVSPLNQVESKFFAPIIEEDIVENTNDVIEEIDLSGAKIVSKEYNNLLENILTLKNEEYLLMINDVVICSGDLEEVQSQADSLVFGEHPSFPDPIPVEQLVILKRIKVKVGLFLEG